MKAWTGFEQKYLINCKIVTDEEYAKLEDIFDNFNDSLSIENSEDIRDIIIKIARKEMIDGGPNKETEGPNKGPQVRKYLGFCGESEPAYWCAAFVSWVVNEACKIKTLEKPFDATTWCPNIATWGGREKTDWK